MSIKNTEKPAMLFYASNFEVLELFEEKEQEKIVLWIMEYGFEGEAKSCPEEFKAILDPIFEGIRVQKNRHENIKLLNDWIKVIKIKAVDIAEKSTVDKIGKAIAALKQEIVECQNSDVDPECVKYRINAILSNPQIRRYLESNEVREARAKESYNEKVAKYEELRRR